MFKLKDLLALPVVILLGWVAFNGLVELNMIFYRGFNGLYLGLPG